PARRAWTKRGALRARALISGTAAARRARDHLGAMTENGARPFRMDARISAGSPHAAEKLRQINPRISAVVLIASTRNTWTHELTRDVPFPAWPACGTAHKWKSKTDVAPH